MLWVSFNLHMLAYRCNIGVQWLWELYCQEAGGIIGDEMVNQSRFCCSNFLDAILMIGVNHRVWERQYR